MLKRTLSSPPISEDFTPEEIARHVAYLKKMQLVEEDPVDDDDLPGERRQSVVPAEPIEPVDPSEPLRGTLYRSMKATGSGRPFSWRELVALIVDPIVDYAFDDGGDAAKVAKSNLPYFAMHVATYRNTAHIPNLSGFIIDHDEADEATVRRELETLGVTAMFPSSSHQQGLKQGFFKVKSVLLASRWMTPAEFRWIYEGYILKICRNADASMAREPMGSYLPACGAQSLDTWWYHLDESVVLDVDQVLAEIGPPPAVQPKKLRDPSGTSPCRIPLSARIELFKQKVAGVVAHPRSIGSGEITGNRALKWVRAVVFAAIALDVPHAGIIEVLQQQNQQLEPHDRWLEHELIEGIDRAETYSDNIVRGCDLPAEAPTIDGVQIPADEVVARISAHASGLLFVKAGMGVGKTQGAAELCRANPDLRVLWITSSVRSARESAQRSSLEFYQSAAHSSTRVVVCIDSLPKWFHDPSTNDPREWDLVICDELPECLNAIFFRCKSKQPTIMLQMLTGLLQLTKAAVVMSADLQRWHIDLCAGGRLYEKTETSELLERHIYMTDGHNQTQQCAWDHCMQLVPDTEKIVVQATSKRTIDAFARRLASERAAAGLPPLKLFVLTRSTKTFDNFDAVVAAHDVILMNTAGGSSLNCWVPIWRQFVILDNNVVVGSAAGQLIARFRKLTEDGMLIVGQRVSVGSGLSVDRAVVEQEIKDAAAPGAWSDKVPYHDGKTWRKPVEEALAAKVNLTIDKRKQLNDPSFVAEAYRRGWTFEWCEWTPDSDPAQLLAKLRITRTELRTEEHEAIVAAPDISDLNFRVITAQGYERDAETEAKIARHMIQRDIYGDKDPPMPEAAGPNDVDWWGAAMRWMRDIRRTPITIEDAKRWRDGAWAREMRRYCLLLMIEHAPVVGHHATEVSEPARFQYDSLRARGEGFEARLIELFLRECFGTTAGAPQQKQARGRGARPVGTPVDDVTRAVLRVYRAEIDMIRAAGWGDRAAPTEETAIAWLGDSLRRAGIRLRRTGRNGSRRYQPKWPPREQWLATWNRLRDTYKADLERSASDSQDRKCTTKAKSRSDLQDVSARDRAAIGPSA